MLNEVDGPGVRGLVLALGMFARMRVQSREIESCAEEVIMEERFIYLQTARPRVLAILSSGVTKRDTRPDRGNVSIWLAMNENGRG